VAERPGWTMAPRKTRRKPKRKKPLRASMRSLRHVRFRLADLDQARRDAIGLGLLAGGAFFAFVFYFGWDGGKVGGALNDALAFLLGDVAYLVPLLLVGAGAALI